jgi:hypothetical protein
MYWAQQIAAAPVVAAFILLLSLIPARHVLMPFWPARVDELIVLAEDAQSALRYFSMGEPGLELPQGLLARTRPLSVALIEHLDGRYTLGYPVGLESPGEQDGASGEPLPPEFTSTLLDSVPGRAAALVLLDANDQKLTLPLAEIRRLYYPNRLSLAGRVRVLVSRALGCWLTPCPPLIEAGHQSVTELQ